MQDAAGVLVERIRALEKELADKDAYIATLETHLRQVRTAYDVLRLCFELLLRDR